MRDGGATDAPAPSVTSTAVSDKIVMGQTPEKNLGQRFFRGSVIGSHLSSSLDARAEEHG